MADSLKARWPNKRGFSAISIRRFCKAHAITRRSEIFKKDLEAEVRYRVQQLGHEYGRKTMHGFLASSGIRVCEGRVRQALQSVAPNEQADLSRLARRQFNPVPYMANRFGEKINLDQNEKLVRYGVTHVLAIDGFSRKVVGFISLSVKNAIEIMYACSVLCFWKLACGIKCEQTVVESLISCSPFRQV